MSARWPPAIAHGSSPLARGTRSRPGRRHARSRFIPARAGNTDASPPPATRPPVHPRSRGEHGSGSSSAPGGSGSSPLARGTHLAPVHLGALAAGSSPLARGTPRETCLYRLLIRFIPARAGNTEPSRFDRACYAVHPRSRGEHSGLIPSATAYPGSSPLARGTRRGDDHLARGVRFIPARAGNTSRSGSMPTATPVHPRSRGEHARAGPGSRRSSGSSPLARGTQAGGGWRMGGNRFIPARAGNTPSRDRAPPSRSVHPRSRGEHTRAGTPMPVYYGSSPLARGTPGAGQRGPPYLRFIPARAGNTHEDGIIAKAQAVHPRSRGEHIIPPTSTCRYRGSSPLARGTLPPAPEARRPERFIPARAGNTHPRPTVVRPPPVHPRSRGEHP